MAFSYPMWIDVEACIYKSSKSYGAQDVNKEKIYVGTSAKYSHLLCERKATRKMFDEYEEYKDVIVFREHHNGIVLKEIVVSKKTREILETREATIEGL
jgi:hypothetical protein